METWIAIAIVVAVLLLPLALMFVTLRGAVLLFYWACDRHGTLGLAAYLACWFLLFPLMLFASCVIGILAWCEVRRAG